MKIATM